MRHRLASRYACPSLIAALICDGRMIGLTQNDRGEWQLREDGHSRAFSPGDRVSCARLLLARGSDAAGTRSLIWINRGALLRVDESRPAKAVVPLVRPVRVHEQLDLAGQ